MLSRTIVLDGLSKTYAMTGWRIGYGVFPENLIEPISRLVTNSVSCTASFTQQAAIEAISGSQKKPNLMVDEFKRRRNIIVDGLNSIPGFNCAMPKGAFYAFPDISGTGFSSGVLANRLLEDAGVALLAGECFGKYGEGFLRISFANSEKNLNEALSRIEKFIKEN